MKVEEANTLRIGIYVFTWNDGGRSLARSGNRAATRVRALSNGTLIEYTIDRWD